MAASNSNVNPVLGKPSVLPPLEYLDLCFFLDEEEGCLYWRERSRGFFKNDSAYTYNLTFRAGKRVGNLTSRGYLQLTLDGRTYKAHRVIYAMANQVDPGDALIDHIDGDKLNNRPSNLRLCDRTQNLRHQKRYGRISKTGIRNVHIGYKGHPYVLIQHKGKQFRKTCKSIKEADELAKKKRKELFEDFAGIGEVGGP